MTYSGTANAGTSPQPIHGEAVAFGMKVATHLAEEVGLLGAADRDMILRTIDLYGEIPPLVTVETHSRVRDAVALLHEHRVSQLPVVSPHDPHTVVGSIGERGLLRHAAQDAELLGAEIVEVMEAPFPAVAATYPVREAVELLVGDQQALLVTVDGRAAGLVTRADLLEALAS